MADLVFIQLALMFASVSLDQSCTLKAYSLQWLTVFSCATCCNGSCNFCKGTLPFLQNRQAACVLAKLLISVGNGRNPELNVSLLFMDSLTNGWYRFPNRGSMFVSVFLSSYIILFFYGRFV